MFSGQNSSEILIPFSEKLLQKLLVKLKEHLPQSIRDHHYLYQYLKNLKEFELNSAESNEICEKCKPKFYSPRYGNLENCTYIAITKEETTDYWIFLSSQEESGKELVECVQNTSLINWNARPIYISCDEKHFDTIYNILKTKQSNWVLDEREQIFYMPKQMALNLEVDKLSDNLRIGPIQLEHANIIDDTWSHRYPGSLNVIKSLIKMNGGSVIYEETGKIIAWILTNEFFSPGFLHTITSERRKGYGNIVTKSEFKKIAALSDVDVCVRVVESNKASAALMKKMGCQLIGIERWFERV